jgi:hypothetical protein
VSTRIIDITSALPLIHVWVGSTLRRLDISAMFYLCRGAYAAFDRCEALSFEIAQFGDLVCPTGQQLGFAVSGKPGEEFKITLRAYAMKRKALGDDIRR